MKELKPKFLVPNSDELREKQYILDFALVASEARKKRNLTYRAAAEEIGITAAYLSDIEKGKEKPPTRKVIDEMIKAYKLTAAEEKEFNELAARARGTLNLALVNLFNGYTAAKSVAYQILGYRDYLEEKQGIIDDAAINKQLDKISQIVFEYLDRIYETEGDGVKVDD